MNALIFGCAIAIRRKDSATTSRDENLRARSPAAASWIVILQPPAPSTSAIPLESTFAAAPRRAPTAPARVRFYPADRPEFPCPSPLKQPSNRSYLHSRRY